MSARNDPPARAGRMWAVVTTFQHMSAPVRYFHTEEGARTYAEKCEYLGYTCTVRKLEN